MQTHWNFFISKFEKNIGKKEKEMFICFVAFFGRIDTGARACRRPVRQQINKYLENHLPCTKPTIINKIKNVRLEKEDHKLKNIQRDLTEHIQKWEIDYIPIYKAEKKRIEELREQATKEAASKGSSKSEQQYKNPSRRFKWNDALQYVATCP